jgi:lysophospholipase L1-like esterase
MTPVGHRHGDGDGDAGTGQAKRRRRPRGRLPAWGAVGLLLGASFLVSLWSVTPSGATTTTAPPYLLALGGSASVGFQPTDAHPHGQPTRRGYAEDLVSLERHRWPHLAVVHLGCPGATTAVVLEGGGHCHYADGDQLRTAQTFLRTHPSTVIVTVDLGFNDLLSCLRHEVVNATCVNLEMATVHAQLRQILRGIKAAAPHGARIVGVGHYDPYLGDYFRGRGGIAFAQASLTVMERLDSTLRADYTAAGVPIADVAAAFELGNHRHVRWSGLPTVPTDVAKTCALTWMCGRPPFGHNLHPDDAGYRAIASAIAAAVAGSSDRAGART